MFFDIIWSIQGCHGLHLVKKMHPNTDNEVFSEVIILIICIYFKAAFHSAMTSALFHASFLTFHLNFTM